MATTSLWHINGRLSDLVAYVENPEKTERPLQELDDLWAAAGYIQRPEATANGRFVTAINCITESAVHQMIATKRQFGKDDGIIAYHVGRRAPISNRLWAALFGAFYFVVLALRQQGCVRRSKNPSKIARPEVYNSFYRADFCRGKEKSAGNPCRIFKDFSAESAEISL